MHVSGVMLDLDVMEIMRMYLPFKLRRAVHKKLNNTMKTYCTQYHRKLKPTDRVLHGPCDSEAVIVHRQLEGPQARSGNKFSPYGISVHICITTHRSCSCSMQSHTCIIWVLSPSSYAAKQYPDSRLSRWCLSLHPRQRDHSRKHCTG